jgi:hypothetical protein
MGMDGMAGEQDLEERGYEATSGDPAVIDDEGFAHRSLNDPDANDPDTNGPGTNGSDTNGPTNDTDANDTDANDPASGESGSVISLDSLEDRDCDGIGALHDVEAEAGDDEELDDLFDLDEAEARELGADIVGDQRDEPRLT